MRPRAPEIFVPPTGWYGGPYVSNFPDWTTSAVTVRAARVRPDGNRLALYFVVLDRYGNEHMFVTKCEASDRMFAERSVFDEIQRRAR